MATKPARKGTPPRRSTRRKAAPLTFTLLGNVWPRLADLREFTAAFNTLAAQIKAPLQYDRKEEMPLLKLATFGTKPSPKGYYRHDGNILALSGVEGDYDGEIVPLADAAAKLSQAGVQAILYTSPSHTPERPRWRVLCPFSVLLEGTEKELRTTRTAMLARVQGVLGKDCALSSESWTLSQTYYIGAKRGAEYEYAVTKGKPVDTVEGLPSLPKQGGVRRGENGKPTVAYNDSLGLDVMGRVRTMTVGHTFHEEVRSIAAHFAGKGLPEMLCYEVLHGIALASHARDKSHPNHARWQKLHGEIDSAIKSAYAKFKPQPPLNSRQRAGMGRIERGRV